MILTTVNGFSFQIDDEDYDSIKNTKWYGMKSKKSIYIFGPSMRKSLHRFLTNAEQGLVVDHINGITTDNRKLNLRVCTVSQNAQNVKAKKSSSTGFKGVHKGQGDCYNVEIWKRGIRYRIRGFKDTILAAEKADDLAAHLHGEFVNLNFPSRTPKPIDISKVTSLKRKDLK